MNQKQSPWVTPRRIVILLCVVLGLVHAILLGWTIQRRSAAQVLGDDRLILEENLAQLQQISQEQIDDLQADLDEIQGEVAALEASFPTLGASYDLFRHGNDLAIASQVELLEISLINAGSLESISGVVLRKQYTVEALGSLENCLDFMDALEQVGLDKVILESATISPGENECSLEISTIGFPSELE
ncbi:MAG: hypothetical protein ACK2TZ_01580 [Anaerolineales bacterium]